MSETHSLTLADLVAAMDRVANAPMRPSTLVMHARTYDAYRRLYYWQNLMPRFDLFPRWTRLRARVRRLRHRIRWAWLDWRGHGYR